MFTGIIRGIGILQKKEKRDGSTIFTIQPLSPINNLSAGMSISVNGACLTCEFLFKDAFKVAVISETLSKTNLGFLHVGSRVNLEPALSFGEKIDGHFVTGHVDDIGKIIAKNPIQGDAGLKIQFPAHLSKFLALKGSVAVNGVSLTIADLQENSFNVALIPYTQQNTNLDDMRENDFVNLEIDLIARYLNKLIYENRHHCLPIQ